jgi:hypothetical protein
MAKAGENNVVPDKWGKAAIEDYDDKATNTATCKKEPK